MCGRRRSSSTQRVGDTGAPLSLPCSRPHTRLQVMISLCFTQCQWNFLLSSRPGFCRLSNFSIATSVRDTAGICTRQSGCLPYMAPELFTKSHRHGASADFWSLGCTMHELIYGLRPWTRTPSKCVSFLEGCVIEGDSGTRSPTAPARACARRES